MKLAPPALSARNDWIDTNNINSCSSSALLEWLRREWISRTMDLSQSVLANRNNCVNLTSYYARP